MLSDETREQNRPRNIMCRSMYMYNMPSLSSNLDLGAKSTQLHKRIWSQRPEYVRWTVIAAKNATVLAREDNFWHWKEQKLTRSTHCSIWTWQLQTSHDFYPANAHEITMRVLKTTFTYVDRSLIFTVCLFQRSATKPGWTLRGFWEHGRTREGRWLLVLLLNCKCCSCRVVK